MVGSQACFSECFELVWKIEEFTRRHIKSSLLVMFKLDLMCYLLMCRYKGDDSPESMAVMREIEEQARVASGNWCNCLP